MAPEAEDILNTPDNQFTSEEGIVISFADSIWLEEQTVEMGKCVGVNVAKQVAQILGLEAPERVEFVSRIMGGGMATAWKLNIFFPGELEPRSYFVKVVKTTYDQVKGKKTRTSLFQEVSMACELINGEILSQLEFDQIINKGICGGFSSIPAINSQLSGAVGVILKEGESTLVTEVAHPYCYTVQPLVEGRSALTTVYDRKNTPQEIISKTLLYGEALCDYADALIAQGCLPTDLKFANTMVDPDDRLLLVDLAGFRFQNLDWSRIKSNQIFKKYAPLEETSPFGVTVTPGNYTPEYAANSDDYNLFVRRSVVYGLLRWSLQVREPVPNTIGRFYSEELDDLVTQYPPELFIDTDIRIALGVASEEESSHQNPERVERFKGYSRKELMSYIIQDNLEIAGTGYTYEDPKSKKRLEQLGQKLTDYIARYLGDSYHWMSTELAANLAEWFISEFMNEDPYKPFGDAIIALQDVYSSMLAETVHD